MKDAYQEKYFKLLQNAKTREDINNIINQIYEDGFQDGANEGREDVQT